MFCISIHAPTRGATYRVMSAAAESKISIHAPTRGATYTVMSHAGRVDYFNSRTYTRCDA